MSEEQEKDTPGIGRRKFVTTVAATGAALTIVPRHVLGRGFQAPSDTLNIATVGIGGHGLHQHAQPHEPEHRRHLRRGLRAARQRADPRQGCSRRARHRRPGPAAPRQSLPRRSSRPTRAGPRTNVPRTRSKFVDQQMPKLKRYKDYREMLDKQKDIDGVVVATPDHMHAPIASAAMDLGQARLRPEAALLVRPGSTASRAEGKDDESRDADGQPGTFDRRRANRAGVSRRRRHRRHPRDSRLDEPSARLLAAGQSRAPRRCRRRIRSVRCAGTAQGVEARLAAALAGNYPVPDRLSWDLFLGVAPAVEYHPIYHPFNWRGWVDWGQGALGDMGAHLIDHPFWGLNLGMPTQIETISTPFNNVCYPSATTTYYQFAARGSMPAVKMTWYDGGFNPPKPEEIGDERLNGEGGILYIGSKGKMLQDTYGLNPRLLPQSLNESYGTPKQKLARITHEEHEVNWVEAIKGKAEISSPFDYAARLVEVMLLGVVSLRAGGKIVLRRGGRTRDQLGQERQQHRRSQSVPRPRLPLGLEADLIDSCQ